MILRKFCVTILLIVVISQIAWADSSGSYYSGDSYHMSSGKTPRCEEINIPMCRGIGYNMTHYPNEFSHDSQDEAGMEVHQFWPLVEIKCSADLNFFLCSMYTPICLEEYPKPVPACRGTCERARDGCAPIMQQYNFQWPEKFNCDNFPLPNNPENLCMEKPTDLNDDDAGTTPSTAIRPTKKVKCTKKNQKNCVGSPVETSARECECLCRNPLISLGPKDHWYNTSVAIIKNTIQDVKNCKLPCKSPFFTHEEQEFAGLWIALWSGLCVISTLM